MQKIWIMLTVAMIFGACQSQKTQEEKTQKDVLTKQANLPAEAAENTEEEKPAKKSQKVGMQAMVKAYLDSLKRNQISCKITLRDEANGYMEYEAKYTIQDGVKREGFKGELAYFLSSEGEEFLASSQMYCLPEGPTFSTVKVARCHDHLRIYKMVGKQLCEAPEVLKGEKDFISFSGKIDKMAEDAFFKKMRETKQIGSEEEPDYHLRIKLPEQGTIINIFVIIGTQNSLPLMVAEMPFDKKTGTFQIKLK